MQWLESYVAADKTFCIYLAENEALVFEHAKLGGFPVTKVTEVPTVISPMTAY
ncbi:MAG: nickel-binding protein [Pseudolabrys sp.]